METSEIILFLNLISTLFMVGLIWFVQIVHYPLFGKVGQEGFINYQEWHQKLTTYVVGPPMLCEAFTTVLLGWYIPAGVSMQAFIWGVVLLFVVWFSTAFLQVPCHGKLLKGFERTYHRRLVYTNWLRTFAWSARGGLVTWMVWNWAQTLKLT